MLKQWITGSGVSVIASQPLSTFLQFRTFCFFLLRNGSVTRFSFLEHLYEQCWLREKKPPQENTQIFPAPPHPLLNYFGCSMKYSRRCTTTIYYSLAPSLKQLHKLHTKTRLFNRSVCAFPLAMAKFPPKQEWNLMNNKCLIDRSSLANTRRMKRNINRKWLGCFYHWIHFVWQFSLLSFGVKICQNRKSNLVCKSMRETSVNRASVL